MTAGSRDAAEVLREAAALMREQHGPEHKRHAMWAAMADLLDLIATRHQPHDKSRIAPEVVCDHDHVMWPCDHVTWALAVATAYLNGESP